MATPAQHFRKPAGPCLCQGLSSQRQEASLLWFPDCKSKAGEVRGSALGCPSARCSCQTPPLGAPCVPGEEGGDLPVPPRIPGGWVLETLPQAPLSPRGGVGDKEGWRLGWAGGCSWPQQGAVS